MLFGADVGGTHTRLCVQVQQEDGQLHQWRNVVDLKSTRALLALLQQMDVSMDAFHVRCHGAAIAIAGPIASGACIIANFCTCPHILHACIL